MVASATPSSIVTVLFWTIVDPYSAGPGCHTLPGYAVCAATCTAETVNAQVARKARSNRRTSGAEKLFRQVDMACSSLLVTAGPAKRPALGGCRSFDPCVSK